MDEDCLIKQHTVYDNSSYDRVHEVNQPTPLPSEALLTLYIAHLLTYAARVR